MQHMDPERQRSADVQAALRSPAEQLSTPTRNHQEERFGYDFSEVRIHRDRVALDSAGALGALAYTVGNDIVFGKEYAPGTAAGERLLAHELAHVVQQSSITRNGACPVGGSTEAGERAAESAAQESTRVLSADLGSFPGPEIQRQERPGSSQVGFRSVDDPAAQTEFEKKVAKLKKAGESQVRAQFLAMDEMFAERVAEAGGKRIPSSATPGSEGSQTFVMVSTPIDFEGQAIEPKLYNATIDNSVYNCHSFTMDERGKTKLQQLAKLAKKVPKEGGKIAGQSYFEAKDLLQNGIHFAPKVALEIYPRWIDDAEMRARLKDYKVLPAGAKIAVGDIVVYTIGETFPHSGKVIAVDKQGKPTMIKSKWGEYSLFEHPPSAVPAHYGTPNYYRKK